MASCIAHMPLSPVILRNNSLPHISPYEADTHAFLWKVSWFICLLNWKLPEAGAGPAWPLVAPVPGTEPST